MISFFTSEDEWTHETIQLEDDEPNKDDEEYDTDDEDDEDGRESSTKTRRWFVCPCFQASKRTSKSKHDSWYTELGANNERRRQVSSPPLSKLPSFRDDVPKLKRLDLDGSSSSCDSDTEEESFSSYDDSDNDTNFSSSSSYTPSQRRVQFTSVEVREYELTVGDHLSPKQYPISLDWNHYDSESCGIDEHEMGLRRKKEERAKLSFERHSSSNNQMTLMFMMTQSSNSINNSSSSKKKNYTDDFRLADATARFQRLCQATALTKDEILGMEMERVTKFLENRRRAAIGLPLINH